MNKWDEMRKSMSGDPGAVKDWINQCNESESKEVEWIEKLRSEGYKAAHPDDGWVNRENNEVVLAYPQYNDGLKVGDKMILGSFRLYSRPVLITGIRKNLLEYYSFKEIKQ